MDEPADRLVAAGRRLVAMGPAVEAGEPWPLSDAYGEEPEASWGPKELLAHVAEMIPYWHGQIDLVLAGDGEPVPFGRVASDADRIARIGDDRRLPAGTLLARIEDGLADVAAALRGLGPDGLGRVGRHPTREDMTVEAIVGRMLIGHLEEHEQQLRGILGPAADRA
jgi:hypothetical protein